MLKVGYKTRAVTASYTGHDPNEAALTMLQSKYATIIVGSCPIQQARVKNSPSNLLQKRQQCYLFVPIFLPKHFFNEFKELPPPARTHTWYFSFGYEMSSKCFSM